MWVSMKPGKKKLAGPRASIVTVVGKSSGWKPNASRAASGVKMSQAVLMMVPPDTRAAPLCIKRVDASGVDMKRPR